MTFWQENYSFIKDVYDSRSSKLIELMDKTDKAMGQVLADKIYTSNEFKKIKDVFMGLARNLEQPDTKDWLTATKDTLMNERGGNEQDEENKKLLALLQRYDDTMPKVNDTKNVVDCLWKAYQFTDELAPYMEALEEFRSKSTRDVNSDSAANTEELIEKHEKCMDQMDKKKKSVLDQTAKGEKILADPKSPKFLEGHVNKLKGLWVEANQCAENRLALLKDNLQNWEKYECQRDSLDVKLKDAQAEFKETKRLYDLSVNEQDTATRKATAATMRKSVEETFKGLAEANDVLAKIAGANKKAALADEVENYKSRLSILDSMDQKVIVLEEFNREIRDYESGLQELEQWNKDGRQRMDDLLKPGANLLPEERVMYTMELQSDIEAQIEKRTKHEELWSKVEPKEKAEESEPAQDFVKGLRDVAAFHTSLLDEVKAEGEKFGEDIKHLADFTSGIKKFEPWIEKSEAKKAAGMTKPKNLSEAQNLLADATKWKEECEFMSKVLEDARASAQKMTVHDDPDAKHATYVKRWEVIEETAKDWIQKLQSMVDVWKKQAETAEKVTAAIAAAPTEDGANPMEEMKLEDLEKHLENLKKMFIEKQKMMEQLEKTAAS